MKSSKIDNQVILVSGGLGSIGSHLVKKLLTDYQPKQLRIFDNNEAEMFKVTQQQFNNKKIRFLIGDVRDKNRVFWALRGVNTVFHCAALKHVNLNEYSPFESVKTNVIGTQNMLEAALENEVETFVNISTDKAANPTSTMGASKLLAERLTSGAEYYKGKLKTIFTSIRFGNVLNSSGSVLPIFMEQIKNGGPLTITDKRMVRYFMTIDEAVRLILRAATKAQGGEVFILKMPALKIIDLAEVLIEKYADRKIEIKEIGKKPGEKLFEKIVTKTEAEQALELKNMYVLPLIVNSPNMANRMATKSFRYFHNMGGKIVPTEGIKPKKLMTKIQIRKLLKQV